MRYLVLHLIASRSSQGSSESLVQPSFPGISDGKFEHKMKAHHNSFRAAWTKNSERPRVCFGYHGLVLRRSFRGPRHPEETPIDVGLRCGELPLNCSAQVRDVATMVVALMGDGGRRQVRR